jgi:Icc-related predicted phosphoesterase
MPLWGKMVSKMKILAVSDQVEKGLSVPSVRERMSGVELIVGCGDLPYDYLEFLLTMLNVPLLYVPGNHDPVYSARDASARAEGGIFLDGKLECIRGLWMAGLGGSIRYRPEGVNQYSQAEMYARMGAILPGVAWNYLRRQRLDILVTHSPPFGIHDDDDLAHTGFSALRFLIRWFKPRYVLHGHTMFYKQNLVDPVTQVGETKVINVYPYRVIELELE